MMKIFPKKYIGFRSQNIPVTFLIGCCFLLASSSNEFCTWKKLKFSDCLWFKWLRVLLWRIRRYLFRIPSKLRIILALWVSTKVGVIISVHYILIIINECKGTYFSWTAKFGNTIPIHLLRMILHFWKSRTYSWGCCLVNFDFDDFFVILNCYRKFGNFLFRNKGKKNNSFSRK